MNQRKNYVIFDGHCLKCSQLAAIVAQSNASSITVLSIHSDEAKSLLAQAFPHGWLHAPYLVIADTSSVRAWTGIQLAIRLAWLLGPTKAWSVFRNAQKYGIRLPLIDHNRGSLTSRRAFLKLTAAIGAAVGLANLPSTTYAQQPCQRCGCNPQYDQVYDCGGCDCAAHPGSDCYAYVYEHNILFCCDPGREFECANFVELIGLRYCVSCP